MIFLKNKPNLGYKDLAGLFMGVPSKWASNK